MYLQTQISWLMISSDVETLSPGKNIVFWTTGYCSITFFNLQFRCFKYFWLCLHIGATLLRAGVELEGIRLLVKDSQWSFRPKAVWRPLAHYGAVFLAIRYYQGQWRVRLSYTWPLCCACAKEPDFIMDKPPLVWTSISKTFIILFIYIFSIPCEQGDTFCNKLNWEEFFASIWLFIILVLVRNDMFFVCLEKNTTGHL